VELFQVPLRGFFLQNKKQRVKETDKPFYQAIHYDPFKLSLPWYKTFKNHLNIKNNQQVK